EFALGRPNLVGPTLVVGLQSRGGGDGGLCAADRGRDLVELAVVLAGGGEGFLSVTNAQGRREADVLVTGAWCEGAGEFGEFGIAHSPRVEGIGVAQLFAGPHQRGFPLGVDRRRHRFGRHVECTSGLGSSSSSLRASSSMPGAASTSV